MPYIEVCATDNRMCPVHSLAGLRPLNSPFCSYFFRSCCYKFHTAWSLFKDIQHTVSICKGTLTVAVPFFYRSSDRDSPSAGVLQTIKIRFGVWPLRGGYPLSLTATQFPGLIFPLTSSAYKHASLRIRLSWIQGHCLYNTKRVKTSFIFEVCRSRAVTCFVSYCNNKVSLKLSAGENLRIPLHRWSIIQLPYFVFYPDNMPLSLLRHTWNPFFLPALHTKLLPSIILIQHNDISPELQNCSATDP